MSTSDAYLARLDAVEARLAAAAAAEPPRGALTGADPDSGEQWDRGQVWAHVAEFIPYWIAQAGPVLRGQASGEPVAFGRTKSDPQRIAAIEQDRREPVSALWANAKASIAALRGFLRDMDAAQWELRGLHPKLGPMTVDELVERFLVGHLEEHAEQLEGMRAASA
jgi:hypothetical protein